MLQSFSIFVSPFPSTPACSLVLVIKLLSLTVFYILVCDLGAGTQKTVFLSASCEVLIGLDNEERWEVGGGPRETHFLSTAVLPSVTLGITLHASGTAAVGSSGNKLQFPFFSFVLYPN